MTRRRALVALGSNIAPERNLPAAAARLAGTPGIEVLRASGVYESPPVGRPGDPCFHNAALLVETTFSPEALREEFRRVEAALGRVRGPTATPRGPSTSTWPPSRGSRVRWEAVGCPIPRSCSGPSWPCPWPRWPRIGCTRRRPPLGEIAAGFDPAIEQVRRLGDALGTPSGPGF